MKLDRAIDDVRDAEIDLAERLRVVGERHAVEHDVYHLGHTLATRCGQHVDRLRPFAEKYGAPSTNEHEPRSAGILETLRHKTSELLGRSEVTPLLLLEDLRDNYLAAQRAEIGWVVLIQVARAVRDTALLDVATSCNEETQACAKWLRTKIKIASPQILAVGDVATT